VSTGVATYLRRSPRLSLAGALAVGAAADVAFDPVHHHVPLCPLKIATGLDCPLCGGLRAVDDLAHGNVVSALHANVLVVAAILVVSLGWAEDALRRHRSSPAREVPRSAIAAAVALAVIFALVRNLPGMDSLRPS